MLPPAASEVCDGCHSARAAAPQREDEVETTDMKARLIVWLELLYAGALICMGIVTSFLDVPDLLVVSSLLAGLPLWILGETVPRLWFRLFSGALALAVTILLCLILHRVQAEYERGCTVELLRDVIAAVEGQQAEDCIPVLREMADGLASGGRLAEQCISARLSLKQRGAGRDSR